jgi:hypothetical protein
LSLGGGDAAAKRPFQFRKYKFNHGNWATGAASQKSANFFFTKRNFRSDLRSEKSKHFTLGEPGFGPVLFFIIAIISSYWQGRKKYL